MNDIMNMSAPNSPRGLPKFNLESHTSHVPPLTPIRQKSYSMRSTYSPRIPSSPKTPISPRKRAQSNYSTRRIENDIDYCQKRIKNMIDVIDRNDSRDTIYCKSSNCCIFPEDINNLSYSEAKFVRREYPSFFSNDRQQYLFLMNQFEDAIQGVSQRFPEYNLPETSKEKHINGINAELDMWFTLFDECIYQESTRSRITAYILKNISEVFRSNFADLFDQVKVARQKVTQIEEYYRKKFEEESLLPPLKSKIEYLTKEIERQKREYKTLEKENARFHVENFQLKNEVQTTKEDVSRLLKTSDVLEGRINQSERRIYDLTLKRTILPLDPTMGAVPDDVLKIWDQSSQFLRDILDDTLDHYDLNEIMPEAMFSPEIETFISMPKLEDYPRDENRIFHFTQLYKSIKFCGGDTDPNNFFNTLELKVRNLFKKFGAFYYNRIVWARKTQIEHISKLNQYNKDLRKKMPDTSIVIKVLLENTEMFNYPKNLPDIQPKITEVFQQVPKLMQQKTKPRSAADIVAKTFTGSDLILFLMVVAKQSQTDIFTDVFKKCILNELPFYVFIFLAKMAIELEGSDMKKRSIFMNSTFSHVGFNSIPVKLRKSFESSYSPAAVTFQIFMIALYQYSIEKVAPLLKDQINPKDVEQSTAVYFKLDELKTLELFQYMAAISPKVKPSEIEFAVCAFDKKVPFDDLIADFNPQQSKIIDYMSNFGKTPVIETPKKKKKKSKSRSASAKSKRTKSALLPLLIGNVISMDESIDGLAFEDEFGVKKEEKPELTETGINGDGLQDIINMRIDANNGLDQNNDEIKNNQILDDQNNNENNLKNNTELETNDANENINNEQIEDANIEANEINDNIENENANIEANEINNNIGNEDDNIETNEINDNIENENAKIEANEINDNIENQVNVENEEEESIEDNANIDENNACNGNEVADDEDEKQS